MGTGLTKMHSEAQDVAPSATLRVLLIEDDSEDMCLVNDYLREAGPGVFSLHCASELAKGLSRLSEGSTDVVILDLFLPDSAGLPTFLQTQSHAPHVPIVILTGLEDEELARHAVREGAQDYLRKRYLSADALIRALRYAAERKRAQEQLQQAQKLEIVGRLADGVAHDFNNLLTVILGNSELLQSCALHGDVAPRAVERIVQAARSAASLTAQLLVFSRHQSLVSVVLNPNDVVEQARDLLRRLVHESIALVIRTDPGLGCIRADPVQIEQVILNLAVNARDAMLPGGTMTIETQNVELSSDPGSTGPVQPGSYVMLAVSDTGPGMDPVTRARMFDLFNANQAHGIGLGLATVSALVKQWGGHIRVDSVPACGSTIRVYFPRVVGKEAPERLDRNLNDGAGCNETILLVEDNAVLCEVCRSFLTGSGYTVLEAGSAEEALAVASDYRGSIHLLLTDVVLPCADGRELAVQLKSARPGIVVLYMSGYSNDFVHHERTFDPSLVLLPKPFTREQLLAFVREALQVRGTKHRVAF